MSPSEELTDRERAIFEALAQISPHTRGSAITLAAIRFSRVDRLVRVGRWRTHGAGGQRRGQRHAANVAHIAGSMYLRATGRPPGRSRNHDNDKVYGFMPFLAAVFRGLGIDASADNHAKPVARCYPKPPATWQRTRGHG